MGSKMIKNKGDNMGRTKNMGVIAREWKRHKKENPQIITQSAKMNKNK